MHTLVQISNRCMDVPIKETQERNSSITFETEFALRSMNVSTYLEN